MKMQLDDICDNENKNRMKCKNSIPRIFLIHSGQSCLGQFRYLLDMCVLVIQFYFSLTKLYKDILSLSFEDDCTLQQCSSLTPFPSHLSSILICINFFHCYFNSVLRKKLLVNNPEPAKKRLHLVSSKGRVKFCKALSNG